MDDTARYKLNFNRKMETWVVCKFHLFYFFNADCSGESIETLLTLLKLPELKTLCKVYKMPDKGLKSEIISKIISKGKQPSITSFFSNASGASTNNNNLRDK